ncbi:hypothetical protein ACFQL0_11135 [Haloplanus litoreus]|uniref:hypothetical protein n=1 Tax=Haloplanus litoreus TaxID=767515 RepID=UPI00360E7660
MVPSSTPSPFGIVVLAIGLFVSLVSLRHVWRSSALLRATAVSRIDGSPDGSLVRLSGTVEAGADTLDAPFSGVDCVALRSTVEERRFGAFLLPTYVTIDDPARSVAFAVRTPHAAIPVAAPLRTVVLDSAVVATVGPTESPPDRIAQYERETDGLPTRRSSGRPRSRRAARSCPLARCASLQRAASVTGRRGDRGR